MITSSKGVALDFDSLSRDIKANSKELYVWSQTEPADLKDVCDRLAFFNFVQGSLAGTLSTKLDAARTPLKALRDSDATIATHRNIRTGYARDIKIETDGSRTNEKRVAELERLLEKAETEDVPLEKEFELLARKSIKSSEQTKWDAIREYGEKLIILSKAATRVLELLPSVPPSQEVPYVGAQATAAIRAAVQHALDHYKAGDVDLAPTDGGVDLSRSDTRSFGETHATELSSIGGSALPPAPVDKPVATSPQPSSTSPVINPQQLNQTPVQIPSLTQNTAPSTAVPSDPNYPTVNIPAVMETGIPQSAGPDGPGPSSGTLQDVRSTTNPTDSASGYGVGVGTASGSVLESAEDEKKRLEREERERVLRAGGTTSASQPQQFESAEDEKKRLERQERERILAAGQSQQEGAHSDDDNATGEDLPPYKEL
jgi:hypothetical protein